MTLSDKLTVLAIVALLLGCVAPDVVWLWRQRVLTPLTDDERARLAQYERAMRAMRGECE